jgi:hypothetical protein
MVTRTALKPPTLLPSRYTQGFLELQIWSRVTFDLGMSERVSVDIWDARSLRQVLGAISNVDLWLNDKEASCSQSIAPDM